MQPCPNWKNLSITSPTCHQLLLGHCSGYSRLLSLLYWWLQAIVPLITTNASLRDAVMLVLRKVKFDSHIYWIRCQAMFMRDVGARMVAVHGYLALLRNFKATKTESVSTAICLEVACAARLKITMLDPGAHATMHDAAARSTGNPLSGLWTITSRNLWSLYSRIAPIRVKLLRVRVYLTLTLTLSSPEFYRRGDQTFETDLYHFLQW